MNCKTLIVCTLLLGSALSALASDPITYKEIAMLLRNGEQQQFILNDTARRKLLHPLSPQEEKELVSLGASPEFLNTLRQPAMIASPQEEAAYSSRLQQQKLTALQQPMRIPQQADTATRIQQPVQPPAQQPANEYVGKPLDLKFTAVDGSTVNLANLRGKVVLIDFWATWCGPCMGEVPNVVAAYKKYHDKGFEIIGISLDKQKDTLLKVTGQKGMTWPQYFDGKGWNNEISSSFRIHSIPAMWLVKKNGTVATVEARRNLEADIEKLLAQ
ncbi:MAG: TlpA disulfide reductase family protein [Verrucomicrobiota bacterium]